MRSSEVFSGEDVRRMREEIGIGQQSFWMGLLGVASATASRWEHDRQSIAVPTMERAKAMLEDLLALKNQRPGVPVNWNNVSWVRSELKKMGRGKPPERIDQSLAGKKVIAAWCAKTGPPDERITPHETVVMAQVRSGVAEADVISLPCQRWLRGWMAAFDEVLAGKTFTAFAVDFTSREEALTALANRAFAVLIASAGKSQVVHYLRGLMVTGELQKAPTDIDTN